MSKREKIDFESIKFHIGTFEELKQKLTPETVEAMMNGATDKNFWDNENLRKSLDEDIAFPAKIWGGFKTLIEITGLDKSQEWEDKDTIREFEFLSELVMRTDLQINPEAKIAAIKRIREEFSDAGIPLDALRGSIIMKLAYIGEAETMELYKIDWRKTPPFSVSFEVNREHPLVNEILKKEQEERTKKLIEDDPDLSRIFDEFYKGKKPTIH